MIIGDESLSLKGLQVLANECTRVTVANETTYKVNVQRPGITQFTPRKGQLT